MSERGRAICIRSTARHRSSSTATPSAPRFPGFHHRDSVALATQGKGRVNRAADADVGLNRQRHQIEAMPHIAEDISGQLANMGCD